MMGIKDDKKRAEAVADAVREILAVIERQSLDPLIASMVLSRAIGEMLTHIPDQAKRYDAAAAIGRAAVAQSVLLDLQRKVAPSQPTLAEFAAALPLSVRRSEAEIAAMRRCVCARVDDDGKDLQ